MPDKAPRQQVDELRDLVVAYAQQETIDPLKDLGKYIAWALAGAVVMGVGIVFTTIAVLRMIQTEGPDGIHKNGWPTVYPYLITLALVLIGAALTLRQTRRRPPRNAQAPTAQTPVAQTPGAPSPAATKGQA